MSDMPITAGDLPAKLQDCHSSGAIPLKYQPAIILITENCKLAEFSRCSDRQRRSLPLPTANPDKSGLTSSAFTLIEIVLSLGIIAFALVGIMGMLPIALNTARESAQESEATLIAQRIFAEIRSAQDGVARITTSPANATLEIDLEVADTLYLAFGPVDTSPTTGAMVPLGTLTQGDYTAGLSPSGPLQQARFIVRVDVIPDLNQASRIAISIEAPSGATSDIRNRTGKYPFVTLVSP